MIAFLLRIVELVFCAHKVLVRLSRGLARLRLSDGGIAHGR